MGSLKKHIDEVKVLLFDISIDVLATRLGSTISDNEMHVPGYEIVRRDRNVNGRLGGGVCFYVRCIINYSPSLDLSIDQIENLCIEIRKPKCKSFLVATWYSPPDSLISTFSYFETLVGRIDAENIIQLLDETEQNIVIYQWRADQLFADAEGGGK